MIEKEHWHPVALSEAVTEAPLAAELLQQPLVLWRDRLGAVQAWADRCPHRGARLSLGRVCAGRLECPYHGWQFDIRGQCVHVPALPDFVPPASHAARTYVCLEQYGLVWVRMGASHAAHAPAFPAFAAEADPQLRKLNCGPYDVATSAPRIVENFLDMAHFGFVHEHWLGSRDTAQIADYAVHSTPTGILATGCKAWQPQSNRHSTSAAEVEYSYAVTAPFTAVLTKLPDPASLPGSVAITVDSSAGGSGYRESIALFICPLGPESSRVWFRLAVADFASSDQQLRDFQHTIFTQDQPVLESQSPKRLPLDVRAEVHTAADKASSAYRRFLSQQAITFGVIP
jgi:phenylpropionate dioxygenase-like ring-hydroxylating dioxygenase large terminal subunit